MTSVVADTHALIWYVCDSDKLSTPALKALDSLINHRIFSPKEIAFQVIEFIEP